jgi:hypothetical protein
MSDQISSTPQSSAPSPAVEERAQAPHRGVIVLVMGILSIVLGWIGLILGPIAWIMGRNDLREMDAGRMDGAGRGHTNAGRICGMIGTCLHATSLLLCVGYLTLVGTLFTSAVNSASRSQGRFQQEWQKAQADAAKAQQEQREAWQRQVQEAEERAKQAAQEQEKKAQEPKPAPLAPKAPDPQPEKPANPDEKGTVDLLKMIDLSRDVVKGGDKWTFTSRGALRCADQHFGPRIQTRYEPPDEYDFIIQFSQEKLRHAVTAMMPNRNGKSFLWKVGVGNGNDYELMEEGGKIGKAAGLLRPKTLQTTTIQVRRHAIRCTLDGRELVNREVNFKKLTIDSWNQIPDASCLGFGCDDPTTFYSVRVVEISGPGRKKP